MSPLPLLLLFLTSCSVQFSTHTARTSEKSVTSVSLFSLCPSQVNIYTSDAGDARGDAQVEASPSSPCACTATAAAAAASAIATTGTVCHSSVDTERKEVLVEQRAKKETTEIHQ